MTWLGLTVSVVQVCRMQHIMRCFFHFLPAVLSQCHPPFCIYNRIWPNSYSRLFHCIMLNIHWQGSEILCTFSRGVISYANLFIIRGLKLEIYVSRNSYFTSLVFAGSFSMLTRSPLYFFKAGLPTPGVWCDCVSIKISVNSYQDGANVKSLILFTS